MSVLTTRFFKWTLMTLVLLSGFAMDGFAIDGFAATESAWRCKYSVRDVAFVNVHGKTWTLELVRPKNVDEETFRRWNQTIRDKLDRTNVGHIWFDPDSREAESILKSSSQPTNGLPWMAVSGPQGSRLTIPPGTGLEPPTLASRLDGLVDSPARREILSQVSDRLCVFVLIQSDQPAKNIAALETVDAAVNQLNRQMWTLEKPTDMGPAFVKIDHNQIDQEYWLPASLGIAKDQLPAVAVVFGQGRRLGEPLSGDAMTVEKLVGRASLCGQDCECDLNRDWLYGQQMIHRWTQSLERSAERSLNFDPNSAFVIAEVAQIIRKNSTQDLSSPRIDLGGGLVIHDLDDLENDPVASHAKTDSDLSPDIIPEPDQSAKQKQPEPIPGEPTVGFEVQETNFRPSVPWAVFLTLLVFVSSALAWIKLRSWSP